MSKYENEEVVELEDYAHELEDVLSNVIAVDERYYKNAHTEVEAILDNLDSEFSDLKEQNKELKEEKESLEDQVEDLKKSLEELLND